MWKVMKEWTTKVGYEAKLMVSTRGTINGYVRVPDDHKAYGMDYYVWDIKLEDYKDWTSEKVATQKKVNEIEVHGSLTYARKNWPMENNNNWIFGFDTAHSGDSGNLALAIEHFGDSDEKVIKLTEAYKIWTVWPGDVHRDETYVTEQCESLAKQLYDIG